MSKYVKNLIAEQLRARFKEVSDAVLVNMVGLDVNTNNQLRRQLRQKNIHVMVVKNSLARRATEGTPLNLLFDGLAGSSAVCWGGDDIVSLAKEVVRLAEDKSLAPFQPRGAVMDGEKLSPEQVRQISKWPGRDELLSILAGQLIGVASEVAGQLVGPAAEIASQIQKMIENKGGDGPQAPGPES